MSALDISVIICTKNRFDDFQETVRSLTRQRRLPDELIVVDASDHTANREFLRSCELPFKSCYFHTRPGLTYQRNYGVQKSRGATVYFFDDDVILDPDYIGRAQEVFDSDDGHRIGAVGGHITNTKRTKPAAFHTRVLRLLSRLARIIFLDDIMGDGKFRLSGMPTHPHELASSQYIECLSGCCMAFRRELFGRIKFDEQLNGYGLMEDADISRQVLEAGYRIYYQASAKLEHKASPDDRLNDEKLAEMRVVNYVYLHRKSSHQTWVRRVSFFWALAGMLLINIRQPAALRGVLRGMRRSILERDL